MIEEARKVVGEMLDKGDVEGVLLLRETDGAVGPNVFRSGDDLEDMVLAPKYALPTVLRLIHTRSPETNLGAVLRGCEERALVELAKRRQVDLTRIQVLGLACTEEEARECGCAAPSPTHVDIGARPGGLPEERELRELPPPEDGERLEFWRTQYAKCMKCYGCRDVCPVCACETCMMAEADWVDGGGLPPAFATFFLIKAYHMADRCVDCHECEAACPVDIPLTELYTRLTRDVEARYGYATGRDVEAKPPLLTALMDQTILEEEG